MVGKEGIMSLYKGAGIVVAAAAPAQAMYFGGYEAVRAVLGNDASAIFLAGDMPYTSPCTSCAHPYSYFYSYSLCTHTQSHSHSLTLTYTLTSPPTSPPPGMGAQLCGSVTWVPMDVIKERLQVTYVKCVRVHNTYMDV
jgi:hypothetical protein